MTKGAQSAICCSCGNEKILALGLCATCYTPKRQDAEYFGGLREQVLERGGYACRVCGDPDPRVHHREPGKSVLQLMIALCAGVSREGPPDEGCPYGVSAASAGPVARAAPRRPRADVHGFQRSQTTRSECATEL
jgi:hypothetical protein